MVTSRLRPKYIERPKSLSGSNEDNIEDNSLSSLIEYARNRRNEPIEQKFTPVEEDQGAIVPNYSSVKEIKNVLEDAPSKVASSGHILSNQDNRNSIKTGYRAMAPIYDYQTKNKSFIKVQKQLELLGIRNNEFHLLLLNPRLQGVDPHDPNITPELALMVIEECQLNFFYYLREVVRIPEQGSGVVMFQLDRATLAAAYCFINDINFYLIKPRQTGKSVGLCAFLSWAFKFGITNGQFAFYANKEKNSKANLKRMKTYIGLLPPYMANMGAQMRDASGKMIRRVNNIKKYYEPVTGNTADTMNCAISEETAEELGRGETNHRVSGDWYLLRVKCFESLIA